MRKFSAKFSFFIILFASLAAAIAAEPKETATNTFSYDIFKISVAPQTHKTTDEKLQLAITFDLEKDWHFYATEDFAPGGMLQVLFTNEKDVRFDKTIFPKAEDYYEKTLEKNFKVFDDKFIVSVPFDLTADTAKANLKLDGAYCSADICKFIRNFNIQLDITKNDTGAQVAAKLASPEEAAQTPPEITPPPVTDRSELKVLTYSTWYALALALFAGLTLNIMPCIWPILPIIVMRIVEQAKEKRSRCFALGIAFCIGIMLFFACLAAANIILQLAYDTTLQWSAHMRNAGIRTGMGLVLVVMALFMFGLFSVGLPASVTGKTSTKKGFAGAVGMGFLAAVLSTPCSFGILAVAFAWAQLQSLLLGTIAILTIGLGMAIPYAILTLLPDLLKKLPKAGRWMDLVKHAIGFILLLIAVMLISKEYKILCFTVILSFCIWLAGTCVTFSTPIRKKIIVRLIALLLTLWAGWALLKPKVQIIEWNEYNTAEVEIARSQDRPVLIKFTADWCTSCKVVEMMVYGRQDIADLIKSKNVLAIKADTTEAHYPATVAQETIYKEPGIPVSILHVPDVNESLRWRGISFADELKQALEKIPE